MTIPPETIRKMESLTTDEISVLIGLVDQLSLRSPQDVFFALCDQGAKKPMTEEEIDAFISDVRKDLYASGN